MEKISRRRQGIKWVRFGTAFYRWCGPVGPIGPWPIGSQLSVRRQGWRSAPPNLRPWFSTRKRCLLQVGEEILPQMEEYKYFGVLVRSKPKGKAYDLCSYPHLWSWTLGHDRKNPWWARPTGRRPPETPRTRWRDYISRLPWELRWIHPKGLDEIADEREVWAFLFRLLPLQWMDGWHDKIQALSWWAVIWNGDS